MPTIPEMFVIVITFGTSFAGLASWDWSQQRTGW
jgi:hypothetical protein